MGFVGTWRSEITVPVPGGSCDSVDTLEIPTAPAVGTTYSMSRHDNVANLDVGAGRRCSFMADGVFKFTVKSVTPDSFVCSVTEPSCTISHSTCGNFACGAPPPNPDVTFTLTGADALTATFPHPETFKRAGGQGLGLSRQDKYELWSRTIK